MNSRHPILHTIAVALWLLAIPIATTLGEDTKRFTGLREWNPPASPNPDQVHAIVGAALIDGRGGPVVQDSVILIRGNKIDAVGDRASVEIPNEATVFEAAGLSVLPGLLDSHFHIGSRANMYDIPPLFLSHGVTTARDPGRPIEVYAPIREAGITMPRCFLTGPHFDQAPPAHPKNAVLIDSPVEARDAVKRYVEQGASAIKVYYRLPLELIRETCRAAHELGVPVTGHLELVDADQAIVAGLDGIEHITSFGTVLAEPAAAESFRQLMERTNAFRGDARYRLWAELDLDNSSRVKPLLDLIVERGVFVSPTLAVMEHRAGDKDTQDIHVRGFENMLRFVGLCHKAGATIVTGSHTFSDHVELGWAYGREMELLVEAGLSPLETITASTLNNARFFGCADRLGTIEPQKLADLVLVKGDPSTDIRAMYEVERVMLNGQWVASE